MPATSTTISLRGTLNKSTEFLRARPIMEFAQSIEVTEELHIRDNIATGTVDQVISMGTLALATVFCMELDDKLDGKVKLKLNGSLVDVLQSKAVFMIGTEITSVSVSNDSGDLAGVYIYLAA